MARLCNVLRECSVYLCPLTVVRLWNEIHRKKREKNGWQVAIGIAWDLVDSDGSLGAAGGETEDHLGCKNTELELIQSLNSDWTSDPFGKLPFLSTCQPLLLCCRPVLTQLLVAWRRIPFARLLFPPAVILRH